MLTFSNDSDILKYEASLFSDLHFPWQVLCSGSDGVLSGTSFSATSMDFTSAGISAGGVVYLRSSDNKINGTFEIVSVDSSTQLTVSVLRSDPDGLAIGIGSGSNMTYRISTFGPQASEAAFELTQYFGIQPGNPDSIYSANDILDSEVLKTCSVYAVISGAYATLGGENTNDRFWEKSLHYKRLFEMARERCRLSIDLGSDGISDRASIGGSIRLRRD